MIFSRFALPLENTKENAAFWPCSSARLTRAFCIIRAYALLRIISAHAHVRIICAHAIFAILFGGRRKLPQAEEVRRPLGPAWRAVR